MADPYAQSGEFVDVLSREAWLALRPPVVTALSRARPERGPIADIGAGTGLGTMVVAATLPTAEVVAVEPSPILRAALLTRLAGDDLARRVTVQAADIAGMVLPDRLGGVLAVNMIGHLAPDQRRAFWADLRPRLAPDAPLIVNVQPPPTPVTVPETPFTSVPVGRRTYQGSGAARPAGPESVIWTMRYRVLAEDGAVERDLVVDYHWYVLSVRELLDELGAAGYTAAVIDMDVLAATPA
ncbi:class I SAM-dependent methyltransferase [Phytohabitans sp. ZYX-F-186]|uniref:Class I SAM-dependent methyltransferase n=1 Tax=Phytohabitans maris TaxID=3071409 RepID=A0ABU0ZSF8_9ACTN|nr:class I SAM-dependent methyltransferase [Phytohabitans sp. ZYX-F-186]MDQ7909942.1 class I SAM-dependent methyltransferase [Phytohabitans sp. ZYX-F-186]